MSLGCDFLDRIPARRFQGDDGYTVEIDLTDDLRGPAGSMHGGLVTALIDIAAATAVAAVSGRLVATASTSIEYLAAGRVGPIRATGSVERVSDGRAVAAVRVVDHGKDDRVMALALVGMSFLSGDAYEAKRS
jgi:uncharacterized protein (TIGR00369 family)